MNICMTAPCRQVNRDYLADFQLEYQSKPRFFRFLNRKFAQYCKKYGYKPVRIVGNTGEDTGIWAVIYIRSARHYMPDWDGVQKTVIVPKKMPNVAVISIIENEIFR